MIELNWYQNLNPVKREFKWYVRPVAKQMLGIHEMAQHMEEHNTPFSAGTIEGILTDFVKCIREQLLNGNSVKIDNLAIFKLSLQSRGYAEIGGIDTKTGKFAAQARVDSAVKTVKLLSTPTGDNMRAVLNRDVRFDWCTEARAEMEAKRKEVLSALAGGKAPAEGEAPATGKTDGGAPAQE